MLTILTGGWAAQRFPNEYIQATFADLKNITRIVTQGRSHYSTWVTKYKISTSQDGRIFEYISCGGIACELDGNSDRNSLVGNEMPAGLAARVVRLHPIEWNLAIGMRWAICGHNADD